MSGIFLDNVKLALSASVGADIVSYTPPPSFIEIRSVAFSVASPLAPYCAERISDLFHCGDYLCRDFLLNKE